MHQTRVFGKRLLRVGSGIINIAGASLKIDASMIALLTSKDVPGALRIMPFANRYSWSAADARSVVQSSGQLLIEAHYCNVIKQEAVGLRYLKPSLDCPC